MKSSQIQAEKLDLLVSAHQPESSSLKNYIIGFVGSISLTLIAYLIASHQFASKWVIIAILAVLALTQFILQLIFFLHLNQEFSPRLRLIVFISMISVVIILVGGSIWIINNLSGRMMDTRAMEQYMNAQNIL